MKIEGGVTITLNHGGSASVSYKGNGKTVSGSGYYGRAAVIAEDTVKAAKAKERGADFDPGTAKGMVSASRGRRPGPTTGRFDPKKETEAAGGEWATAKGLKPGDEVRDDRSAGRPWKKVKAVQHHTGSGFSIEFEDGTSTSGGSSTKYGIKRQASDFKGETFSADSKLQPGDKLLGRPGEKDDEVAYVFLGYDDKGKMILEEPGERGRVRGNRNATSGRTRLTTKSPRVNGRIVQRKGDDLTDAERGQVERLTPRQREIYDGRRKGFKNSHQEAMRHARSHAGAGPAQGKRKAQESVNAGSFFGRG